MEQNNSTDTKQNDSTYTNEKIESTYIFKEQTEKCIEFYTKVFNVLLSMQPTYSLDTQVIWNRNQTSNEKGQMGEWNIEKGREQYILDGYVYKQFYVTEKQPTYFLEYYPVSNKTYLMKLVSNGIFVYTGDDKVNYIKPETWPKLIGVWSSIEDHISTLTKSNSDVPENVVKEKKQFLEKHYEKLQTKLSERDNLLDAINKYTK